MSLLEDIFLQDEANEAHQLERIIEGEEFDERIRSDSDDDSEKEDEAEEDKRRVEPNTAKVKRVTKNPRFILNPARLTGPRGIQVLPEHFKDFKFQGKGREKEDLDLVLKKLEHWAYRLYPKFQFEDCLKKIETLGKKRAVMVHLHKIRSDQYVTEEAVMQKDSSDEDMTSMQPEEDEFDKLLQQQIDIARSTPAPISIKKASNNSVENRLVSAPKATSSPSISDDQRERMLKSRKLAEERRLARLKETEISEGTSTVIQDNTMIDNSDYENLSMDNIRKSTKSNVLNTSDEEDIIPTVINEPVAVDVHNCEINNETNGYTSVKDKTSDNIISENLITHCDNDVDSKDISKDNNGMSYKHSNNSSEVATEIQSDSKEITNIFFLNSGSELHQEQGVNQVEESIQEDGNAVNVQDKEEITNKEVMMEIDFCEEF